MGDPRRFRGQRDIDEASEATYRSEGTVQSHSSAFVGKGRGKEAGMCDAKNRTVVLDGLPKSWPTHQVVAEVQGLLKRMWEKDGFRFNPERDLHLGNKGGGIDVKKPVQNSKYEN